MIVLAIAALAVAALVIVTSAGLVRSLVRQQARERTMLLDRLMHLADHTWTPPPATVPREERKPRDTIAAPEQMPDGWEGA